MSDAATIELGERFRRGEEAAIREVHARYAGPVSTVARSVVRDPELVSEIVQQTFVKAWRAAATFEGQRDLAPWLYSIARRTAIDVVRRENRGGVTLIDIDDVSETAPAPGGPTFERTWERWEIRAAVDDLPPGEREVVKLQRLMGMTHPEIAEHLGVPVGTVKSRSAKAHKRLAAALRHLQPGADSKGSSISANSSAGSVVEGGEGR
ncbi:MAG: RNA polymerase sigma factor [Acidimicrobiales bacterium]